MKVTNGIDLTAVVDRINAECGPALTAGTEYVLTEANKTVPHDDGTLERSGHASNDGKRGAVSYDTPYAVRQHEDMSLHHDGKGEAKWLETTMARESKVVGQIVATKLREGLT